MRRLAPVAVALVVVAMAAHALADTEIDTCGQIFSGSGFLSGNLDCTGFPNSAVTIEGGKLDLRGFTLTGGGIRCTRSCSVVSAPAGGRITGSSLGGIYSPTLAAKARINVSGVVVDANGETGIHSNSGKVIVTDSIVTNSAGPGVGADRKVQVEGSTISNNGTYGVVGTRVRVDSSSVSDNGGSGVFARRAAVLSSEITGNGGEGITTDERTSIVDTEVSNNTGYGVIAFGGLKMVRSTVAANGEDGIWITERSRVTDCTIMDNGGHGVEAWVEPLRMTRTTIVGNALSGVEAGAAFNNCGFGAVDSTFIGNGTDSNCGVSQTCADVATCEPPNLVRVVCETSYDTGSGFPGTSWQVCSLD